MAHRDSGERLPADERARPQRIAPYLLALAVVLVPLILACGASLQTLKTAPASQLQLWLTFDYDSIPMGSVSVTAEFRTARQGSVVLTGGQSLYCDGVNLVGYSGKVRVGASEPWLHRQPPGGAYTCVYTDERGQRTTVTIPVPTGTLAITNPAVGAQVPIPPPVPKPTPVTPLPTSGLAPPRVLHEPLVINYTMPVLPPGGHAVVQGTAGCPRTSGGMVCDTVHGPQSAAQGGTYVLADPQPPIASGFDYLYPGPGYVSLALTMDWSPAPQGFQQIHVETRESVTNAVTWTPGANTPVEPTATAAP